MIIAYIYLCVCRCLEVSVCTWADDSRKIEKDILYEREGERERERGRGRRKERERKSGLG